MENISLKLEDFLPSYPVFEKEYNDPLFKVYTGDYNKINYLKKEFNIDTLDPTEKQPDTSGILLKHQDFLSKFMSRRTLNDSMLVFHQVGTGKTCSAIAVAELSKRINPNLKSTLVLVKGNTIKRNFIKELAFRCTKDIYIPDNFNELTSQEKVVRLNKKVNKQYDIRTFETFAKKLSTLTDKLIIDMFSDRDIIIDEIHNIRISHKKKKKDELDVYFQFHRFLHLVKNTKKLLLTGTPMRDTPDEFASVMNLILPLELQLPTGIDFTKQFFDEKVLINKKQLKEAIRGRVSYLRSMESEVVKINEGKTIGKMKKINTIPLSMKGVQLKSYIEAINLDLGNKKDIENVDDESSGLYENSRQASLFVFPDGSYGTKGFNNKKWINERKGIFTLTQELKNILTNNGKASNQEKLDILSNFSCKFTEAIREIIKNPDQNIFVYTKFVKGSGAILFGELLKLFEYR